MRNFVGLVLFFLGLTALALTPAIGVPRPQAEEVAPQRGGAGAQGKEASRLPLAWAYASALEGAPEAAPIENPQRDDGKLRHLPDSTLAFTMAQINSRFAPADWFPSDHPQMPEVVAHGRKPDGASRVRRDERACAFCHYPNGKGLPENAGLAGLSAAYILRQLSDFASGARKSMYPGQEMIDMTHIAPRLTEDEAKDAANYFSSMKWTPWVKVIETDTVPKTHRAGAYFLADPGSETISLGQTLLEVPADGELRSLRDPHSGLIAYVPPGTLTKGEALVLGGGAGKTLACAACHGEGLKGNGYFPSLAGRDPTYLGRQLYDFQHFSRVGPGAQLMQPIVKNLSEDDIVAIAAYIASLTP